MPASNLLLQSELVSAFVLYPICVMINTVNLH